MSESFEREVGEKLRLSALLEDNDKYVQAFLYDASNSLISIANLSFSANGLYVNDVETMPNQDQVKAIYKVYEDAGFTELSCEYGTAIDYYEKVEIETGNLVDPTRISAKVTDNPTQIGNVLTDQIITGEIESAVKIKATVEDEQVIKATITESTTITGVVTNE